MPSGGIQRVVACYSEGSGSAGYPVLDGVFDDVARMGSPRQQLYDSTLHHPVIKQTLLGNTMQGTVIVDGEWEAAVSAVCGSHSDPGDGFLPLAVGHALHLVGEGELTNLHIAVAGLGPDGSPMSELLSPPGTGDVKVAEDTALNFTAVGGVMWTECTNSPRPVLDMVRSVLTTPTSPKLPVVIVLLLSHADPVEASGRERDKNAIQFVILPSDGPHAVRRQLNEGLEGRSPPHADSPAATLLFFMRPLLGGAQPSAWVSVLPTTQRDSHDLIATASRVREAKPLPRQAASLSLPPPPPPPQHAPPTSALRATSPPTATTAPLDTVSPATEHFTAMRRDVDQRLAQLHADMPPPPELSPSPPPKPLLHERAPQATPADVPVASISLAALQNPAAPPQPTVAKAPVPKRASSRQNGQPAPAAAPPAKKVSNPSVKQNTSNFMMPTSSSSAAAAKTPVRKQQLSSGPTRAAAERKPPAPSSANTSAADGGEYVAELTPRQARRLKENEDFARRRAAAEAEKNQQWNDTKHRVASRSPTQSHGIAIGRRTPNTSFAAGEHPGSTNASVATGNRSAYVSSQPEPSTAASAMITTEQDFATYRAVMESALQRLRGDVASRQEEEHKLKGQLARRERLNTKLKVELANTQRELHVALRKCDETAGESSEAYQALQAQARELQGYLDDSRVDVFKLKEENAELHSTVVEMLRSNADLKETVSRQAIGRSALESTRVPTREAEAQTTEANDRSSSVHRRSEPQEASDEVARRWQVWAEERVHAAQLELRMVQTREADQSKRFAETASIEESLRQRLEDLEVDIQLRDDRELELKTDVVKLEQRLRSAHRERDELETRAKEAERAAAAGSRNHEAEDRLQSEVGRLATDNDSLRAELQDALRDVLKWRQESEALGREVAALDSEKRRSQRPAGGADFATIRQDWEDRTVQEPGRANSGNGSQQRASAPRDDSNARRSIPAPEEDSPISLVDDSPAPRQIPAQHPRSESGEPPARPPVAPASNTSVGQQDRIAPAPYPTQGFSTASNASTVSHASAAGSIQRSSSRVRHIEVTPEERAALERAIANSAGTRGRRR